MVVEMVEKLMEEVGFLVKKEEDEGGEVVVVVRMEEEMEERKVVELVVEKMKEVEKMAGQREGKGLGGLLDACWKWRRKEKNERERRRGCVYIKGILGLLQDCHPIK